MKCNHAQARLPANTTPDQRYFAYCISCDTFPFRAAVMDEGYRLSQVGKMEKAA